MNTGLDTLQRERFYDRIAESFDDIMNAYDVNRRLEVVFDELLGGANLTGLRLLDAGCGTGRFSEWARQRGAAVTSVDIGPALLKRVRHRCDSAVVCGDVTRLPFAEGAFDVVVSSECIEHTTNPREAVAELLRVCRAGGRLVITCPNRFWKWSCTLANALGIRPYKGHENWPGWFQLRRWIREQQGECRASKGIHLFPFVIRATHPLLRGLDRLGGGLGPVFVNQAVLATK